MTVQWQPIQILQRTYRTSLVPPLRYAEGMEIYSAWLLYPRSSSDSHQKRAVKIFLYHTTNKQQKKHNTASLIFFKDCHRPHSYLSMSLTNFDERCIHSYQSTPRTVHNTMDPRTDGWVTASSFYFAEVVRGGGKWWFCRWTLRINSP